MLSLHSVFVFVCELLGKLWFGFECLSGLFFSLVVFVCELLGELWHGL